MPEKVLLLTRELSSLAGYQQPLKQSPRSWPKQTELSLALLLQTRQACPIWCPNEHLQRLWHMLMIAILKLHDFAASCSKIHLCKPTFRLIVVTEAEVVACYKRGC